MERINSYQKVLSSLVSLLNGKRIKWFTDNQNVVSIINKGSRKHVLQCIAIDIFSICLRNNLTVDIEWIPRTLNEKADYLSRILDHDDWGISDIIFSYVESLWGPHEIDWFASDHNYKLVVFYSRFWNTLSSGVDAFSVDWNGINGLFVPPVCIIPRVLHYMRQCMAVGTLILPLWKSASFWPMLCPRGEGFITQVKEYIFLPTEKEYYTAGKSRKVIFGNSNLPFNMLAFTQSCNNSDASECF